jgi:hypothetical protein
MICQQCEEEYQFENFKFDFTSLRAFATFSCLCETKLVLPEEECSRLELLDGVSSEQLRHLHMMALRFRLDKESSPNRVYLKALDAHKPMLVKYLEEITEKGLMLG